MRQYNKLKMQLSGQASRKFPYSEKCIICDNSVHVDKKHPDRQEILHKAST